MNASKSERQIAVAAILLIAVMTTSIFTVDCSAQDGKKDDQGLQKLVGNWTGESICTEAASKACNDEKVIYRFAVSSKAPNTLTLTADKIVNGKPETMGVQELKYDPEKATLTGEFQNARYHGLWEFTVKGNVIEGTLSLLPEKTIVRRVHVKKDE